MIHFHRPLTFKSAELRKRREAGNPLEFVGAVCPGFDLDNIDWKGCGMDTRAVADKDRVKENSDVWAEAVDAQEA